MEHNLKELQNLRQPQFEMAKRWWAMAMASRLMAVGISIVSIFANQYVATLALFTGALTIIYSLFQWRADSLQSTADSILRRTEFFDGLGWEVSGRELMDIKMSVPNRVRQQSERDDDTHYFASQSTASPRRLIENLEESACFTKHQARYMYQIVSALALGVFVVAIVTLIIALQRGVTQPVSTQIARIVITAIVFVFSAGYVRLAYRYHSLSIGADRIDDRAHALLQADLTQIEAVKLLHDYQILRAKAPLLPSWLWKWKEPELNQLWQIHRANHPREK